MVNMLSTFVFVATTLTTALYHPDLHAKTSEDQYDAAVEQAESNYKAEEKKCDKLSGDQQDICMAEAKADEKRAKAKAESQHKGTAEAAVDERIANADADYMVQKAKCDAKEGNDKDVCIKQAKLQHTKVVSEAKQKQASADDRRDAREDRREARYELEKEKCDSLSGNARDNCLAAVEKEYDNE